MASPRVADRVGQVLGGRYRLIAPLGSGASASVYLGDDVTLRRRVAVKVLHQALADDEAFLRRFRAEAQAAAALNHPHVMAVHDWGQDDEVPYLITEFLGGGDLRSMLDQNGPLTLSQTLLVGLEAARGLDGAHRQGLVHRDIKPANLLFDDEARLRIADFGLARALAEAAWTEPVGAVLGTARYASPEQARGQALDGRSDVYSLAVVLVEAALGEAPFNADTPLGTLMARVDTPLPVPSSLGPLAPVLAAAGNPDPEDRPDATEFGEQLFELARGFERPDPLPLLPTFSSPGSSSDGKDQTFIAGSSSAPDTAGEIRESEDDPSAELEVPPWVSAPGTATVEDLGDGPDPADEPRGESADTEDGDGSTGVRSKKRRKWVLLTLVVLLGIAAGGAAYWWAEIRVVTHEVPELVGGTLDEAQGLVDGRGWSLEIAESFDEDAAAGTILSQDVAAGEQLEEGESLGVTVSLGPPPVAVPDDLAGVSLEEATEILDEAGFTVGELDERHDEEVPADHVLGLADGVGEEEPMGSSIPLVVSIGPEPRTVPGDLVGMNSEQARATLEELGLVMAGTEDFSEEVPEGEVMSVPQAGEEVERDSEVTVVVSAGPPVVTVPDIVGDSVVDAASELEALGLVVASTQGSPTQPVSGTDPAVGETVQIGSSITLITD